MSKTVSSEKLKETSLIPAHKALNARMAGFGGWLMPIQYEGIIAEHNWTRDNVSLFDICHMGEFIIKGTPQDTGLDKILTANLTNMKEGSCRYGFMLNEEGGIIDDVITYKIKDDEWMLVVNATTIETDQAHVEKHLLKKDSFENASGRIGKLDLQGPFSCEVLTELVGEKIIRLGYYKFEYYNLFDEKCLISRTGYTGELGYEIYISTEKINDLWKLLLENNKIKPAGLGARDTLRLEMGMPLYGQDVDTTRSPLEAGFEKFVDFNKDFIGKDALLKKKEEGIKEKLSFFIAEARRAPRHNYKIYGEDKEIGTVTSGSFSPSLLRGIGMGYIKSEYGNKKISLRDKNVNIEAVITEKPFYKQGTARI